METKRLVVPAAEEILNTYFAVHDHGFVALVDYMGGDAAIDTAARTSVGGNLKERSELEQTKLLGRLMKDRHTSPFEMVELKFHCAMPIFVARQWIRHRTACLSGDTILQFDLPGGIERRGNQLYTLSMREVYEKFQPTKNERPDKQRNPFHKRERVQAMYLRCLNESTNEVTYTRIVDIWQSGIKPVYKVAVEIRGKICSTKMSQDHLCLTSDGWRKLREIAFLPSSTNSDWESSSELITVGPGENTGVKPSFNSIDVESEEWVSVLGWEEYYEVSSQGRVRRVVGEKGSRSYGRCKMLTVSNNHAVVSLNRPGVQETHHVHELILSAFIGPKPEGTEGLHKDGNGLNNTLENLRWGTPLENASDRIRDDATTSLRSNRQRIFSIEYMGEEMTYDLEVEGPYHNFSANGLIVHNSVNEYSGRYSKMPCMFYMPEPQNICHQNKKNKQGRGEIIDSGLQKAFRNNIVLERAMAAESYAWCLENDISRELARIDLPLATYTQWYWKIDLHNLLHFLKLRLAPDAQFEIREYATRMAAMTRAVAPLTYEHWDNYVLNAILVSRDAVRQIALNDPDLQSYFKGVREEITVPPICSFATRDVQIIENEWG